MMMMMICYSACGAAMMMICYSACGIAGSCSHRVPTRVKENEQSTAAWQAVNATGACEARMATPQQPTRNDSALIPASSKKMER